jgi:hypothetical protein
VHSTRIRFALSSVVLMMLIGFSVARPEAWGVQGHRLVALIAADQLSQAATLNVAWLLPDSSLAQVAVWADQFVPANSQTGPWHYVNLPADATSYDRDRDCPRQPGRAADDRWRDCVVDRIPYHQARLADRSLDRADRAIALKFLVHFIGDLHQPFHALDVARGGNDIPVVAFGSATCRRSDGTPASCNLHGIWDTTLIAHRQLSDRQYLAKLSDHITRGRRNGWAAGSPAAWAMESHALAKRALLPRQGVVDEAYFRAHISAIDQRLVQGGLRLAAALNQSLSEPPPR